MQEQSAKKQIEEDAKWAWNAAGNITGSFSDRMDARGTLAAEMLAQLEKRSVR